MLAGPLSGLTATASVSGEATRRAARPIQSVIDAVVFGLTIRIRMVAIPNSNLAAQVERLYSLVLQQLIGLTRKGHRAGRERVGAV